MRSFTVAVFMALLACGALAATPLITLDFASTFTSGYTTVAPYTGGGTSGSGLWLEGTETVAANPHDLHELWTSFTAPETGGKMLIVNGAVVGGKEVWSKNFSLAAGSYDFSFMAASSYPVSPASLRLFVNDVAVGSLLDLTDTAGAWQTFTESFTASGSTTKLSLVDTKHG